MTRAGEAGKLKTPGERKIISNPGERKKGKMTQGVKRRENSHKTHLLNSPHKGEAPEHAHNT